jgi:hypothetical protein
LLADDISLPEDYQVLMIALLLDNGADIDVPDMVLAKSLLTLSVLLTLGWIRMPLAPLDL